MQSFVGERFSPSPCELSFWGLTSICNWGLSHLKGCSNCHVDNVGWTGGNLQRKQKDLLIASLGLQEGIHGRCWVLGVCFLPCENPVCPLLVFFFFFLETHLPLVRPHYWQQYWWQVYDKWLGLMLLYDERILGRHICFLWAMLWSWDFCLLAFDMLTSKDCFFKEFHVAI